MTSASPDGLQRVAELWAAFPVHAETRPLVLTAPALVETGFTTGEAKLAFGAGRIDIAAGVPGEAVRSLQAAEVSLAAAGPGHSVRLSEARTTTHAFWTDRGPRALRAWRLLFREAVGPMYVLDEEEIASSWSPPGRPTKEFRWPSHNEAGVAADGRSFEYRFFGEPQIYADYRRTRLLETPAVVVASPESVDIGGSETRLLYAQLRVVSFRLQEPLGHRVLVDGTGRPVPVTKGPLNDVPMTRRLQERSPGTSS